MLRTTAALRTICAVMACGGIEPGAPSAPTPDAEPAAAPPPVRQYSEKRDPCADHNPLRNAYFGDFHVHTNISMDAYIFGTNTTARDAYRFARGEPRHD